MASPEEIQFTTWVTERARWFCEEVLLPNARRLEGATLEEKTATALLLPFLVHLRLYVKDELHYEELCIRFRAYVEFPSECISSFPEVHKATNATVVSEDSARALLVLFINIIHEPREFTFRTKDLFD